MQESYPHPVKSDVTSDHGVVAWSPARRLYATATKIFILRGTPCKKLHQKRFNLSS